MNHTIARGTPRPKLSLRYGAAHPRASTEHTPVAAAIPAIDLRRIVATMVD
ncbi:hypothetical protein [Pelagerythrobacter marinus]|uniref:hypothetical protein n=1 Tax=Pelagerythrobacter marinus TaxID=538382 RepID=UPI002AC8A9B3|nr:hypothetical protein [Pelagerythrobacter marinus]WPZ07615.1 hypothetical protein T8T98_03625 [Pelagerythrobacter marinus]